MVRAPGISSGVGAAWSRRRSSVVGATPKSCISLTTWAKAGAAQSARKTSKRIRRGYHARLAPMKALLALLLWIMAGSAAAQAPVEGKQYRELRPPVAAPAGEKVEVIEFFYYGCAVCYEAQPHLARWLAGAGKDVTLRRVPAVFTESSESFARTFFTLEAMNQLARLHWPLYD